MAKERRSLSFWLQRVVSGLFGLAVLASISIFVYLYWKGRQQPATDGEYVALGSSFAAGIGLGPRAPGSPIQCFRTIGGYPSLVARRTGLRFVDMTCSGSTTEHILDGGQMMLGPQLAAVSADAKLVTITSGGNDIGYVGDLVAVSGSMGRQAGWLHGSIKTAASRPYAQVQTNLETIVAQIRQIAPKAKILIVSYPTLLPLRGNCGATGVSDRQVNISRSVAARLVEANRLAAVSSGALFVDMGALSHGHDVCSDDPWVNGTSVKNGTPFHPNGAGSAATAAQVEAVYRMD